MKIRRFRAYGEREDLLTIFGEFQNKLGIYYVPTYSDIGEIYYHSIMDIENIGVNFWGSHGGNMQMLIFLKDTKCQWRTYRCKGGNGQEVTRYSTLCDENSSCISVDLNGRHNENTIFPTEICTMYYDDEIAKRMYDELKKIFRKRAAKTVNGIYVCLKAYEHKTSYRFCTIDIKSSPEYDLKVE